MNATLKRTFVFLAISAMLVCSSVLVAANAQNNSEEPVGKEIASTFREIAKGHQNSIENYIMQAKVDAAQTADEKLEVIDQYLTGLKGAVEDTKAAREALIAELDAETIDGETFGMQLKDIAIELANTAKTMGDLGVKLGEIGQELAATLTAAYQALAQELAAAGQAIGQELSNIDLPVPDIPEVPDIPQIPDLPNIPNVP
jgi:hypothetical protein